MCTTNWNVLENHLNVSERKRGSSIDGRRIFTIFDTGRLIRSECRCRQPATLLTRTSMHNSQHSVSKAKVTVRYEGDVRDGHDVNDNISPDFSSRATLTRRQHLQITHKLVS